MEECRILSALPQIKSLTFLSTTLLSQVMNPKFFDDYLFSETTEIFIQESSLEEIDNDFQADLQQSNAYNPFSEKIKEDDSGHGQCRAIRGMRDKP